MLHLVTLLSSTLWAQFFKMSYPRSLNRARHQSVPLPVILSSFITSIFLFSSPIFSFFIYYLFFSPFFSSLLISSLTIFFFISCLFIPSLSRFFWFLLISSLYFLHRQVSTDYGWRWKLGHRHYIWNETEIQKWSCGIICSIWIHRISGTWVRSKCLWYVLHKFVYLRWVCVPTFSLHRNFYTRGISRKNDFHSVKNVMCTFLLML